MADDVFSLFRTSDTSAAQADTKPADSSDVFRMFQSDASQTKKQSDKPAPPPLPSVSEYGDLGNAWWNTQANPPGYVAPPAPAAPTLPGPGVPSAEQQTADTGLPLPQSPPPNLPQGGDVLANALQPAPNTTYMGMLPIARDDKTGEIRYGVLPRIPREMLLGTVQGIRDIFSGNVGAETTVDPSTGQIQYGMTPGANLLLSGGARPLAFSGPSPLQFVPPGTFDARTPLSPQFTASPMAAELEARLRGDTTAGAARPGVGQTPAAPVTPTAAPPTTGAAAQTSAAPTAPSGGWRPYQPNEVVPPGSQFRLNPETRATEVLEPSAAPQTQGVPTSAQPTGAQVTPTSAAQMTPEQIATQRTVADKQWLNQTQQPGVQDTTEHIPGITPNLVEQEQTVVAARELKDLKNQNPALTDEEKAILDRNTNLRKGFYADTVGSDVTRAADLKTANDKINTDLATVWQGKGQADAAPVKAQIKTELDGSAGDLPPLKAAMKQVSDSLENAGTDPQAMYRTHRLINFLQSRQGQLANPGYGAADVQAALTRTKATLAQTIDNAAPGFGKAMSDYSGARGPIDAAKVLQDREDGLYDSRGHFNYLKVHSLMRDITDAQKWDAPSDPLAGVSDAQMTRLKALHDDLKRTATAKDLATAQGSDTVQNLVDLAKSYGKLGARAGVEGGANWLLGPGTGSLVVRGAENLLRPFTSGIAGRKQMRRGMEILQPPPNPLNPPSP